MIGWCPPTKIDDDGKTMVKTKSEWTSKEEKSATSNWMALNAIQYGVDSRQFSLIATSESAKEVWDTLQVISKGCKEGEDHINEPVAHITHLKNTVAGDRKQEVPKEVSINVQTRLVPAPIP